MSGDTGWRAALDAIAALDKPDWDGYGAAPIDDRAVAAARAVCAAADAAGDGGFTVHPDLDGGVAVSWRKGERVAEVALAADGGASCRGFADAVGRGWWEAPAASPSAALATVKARLVAPAAAKAPAAKAPAAQPEEEGGDDA